MWLRKIFERQRFDRSQYRKNKIVHTVNLRVHLFIGFSNLMIFAYYILQFGIISLWDSLVAYESNNFYNSILKLLIRNVRILKSTAPFYKRGLGLCSEGNWFFLWLLHIATIIWYYVTVFEWPKQITGAISLIVGTYWTLWVTVILVKRKNKGDTVI